jgi:HK97 family phage major capsid protein
MARQYVRNTADKQDRGAQLLAMLDDPAALARFLQGTEDQAHALLRQIAANFAQGDDLDRRIEAQTQQVLAQLLRGNGHQGDAVKRLNLAPGTAPPGRGALYNAKAPGAQVDAAKLFDGSADYFQAIWHRATGEDAAAKQARLHRIRNDMGTTVPADGGFLVPEVLRSDVLALALETSIVRPRATVIPMSSLRVPIPAVDETSHASSVHGGIVGYWTEEGAALTESQPSFGRVVLDAKKLTIYTEVNNELMADAPAFGGYIDRALPTAIEFYEDSAFLNGSGVGEPLGVLKGSGLLSVTRTTASKIDWLDILAMVARLLPSSFNRAVWVASPATLPELGNLQSKIKNVAGTENVGGSAIWLTSGASDVPTGILGRPLLISEKVPTLGTAGDLCLVDFGHYLIGDRQVMSAMSSPHFKFQNDQTAIRVIERVDGRPWLNSAITPKNGGATLSPYVRLS